MDTIKQFPHCDPLILHAPGVCQYCDKHSDWQQLREMWGINFTGEHKKDKAICPAEILRPIENIENWHGNIPEPKITEKTREEFFQELNEAFEEVRLDGYAEEVRKSVTEIMNDSGYKWKVTFEVSGDRYKVEQGETFNG